MCVCVREREDGFFSDKQFGKLHSDSMTLKVFFIYFSFIETEVPSACTWNSFPSSSFFFVIKRKCSFTLVKSYFSVNVGTTVIK